jgi:pimeloyl-ACP methyl ester carboxylesterase
MDFEHRTLKHNGLSWHVATSGPADAYPVLLLHCWSGNWTLWRETIERLAGQYRFIALDHLGFGQSDKPRGDHYQIEEQAQRAKQIMDLLGYQQFHLIGHSMGGQIALTLASLYPEAVTRLIVIAPAVNGKRLHPWAYLVAPLMFLARQGIEFPYRWLYWLGSKIPDIAIQFMRAYFPKPRQHREAAMYWLHQIMADGQLNASAWAQKAINGCDVTPQLNKIAAPTLAIWGLKDYCVPVAQCDLLEREISNCRAVRLPEIGHFPMIEAFEAYLQPVQTFLSEGLNRTQSRACTRPTEAVRS